MSNEWKVESGQVENGISSSGSNFPLSVLRLSRFDRVVLGVIVALAAGIGLTILLGDRVGVTLERVGPSGMAGSSNRITMQFSEAMKRDTVETRFRTEPEMTGVFSWSENTLSFQPDEMMTPGEEVRVALAAGAESESGRTVLSEYQYSFTVRRPRVIYLYPSDDKPYNLWIADPADPSTAEQLTFSTSSLYDYAVSPDGSQIAFSEEGSNSGTNNIQLLDLETGGVEPLTNCIEASCTTPVWRPDGNMIVYDRVDFNSDLNQQGVGSSPSRLWMLDLTSRPVQTRPLFSDLRILGYDAQWSADGQKIALYDRSIASILIYDFTEENFISIESGGESSGGLSPDGTEIAYEEMSQGTDGYAIHSYLNLVNFTTNERTRIGVAEQGFSDSMPLWRPDGQVLAFIRRDEGFAPGNQLFLFDPNTGEEQRLTDEPRYTNGFFEWDPTGTQIVMQRFPVLNENMQPSNDGLPEIWTLDVETGTLTQMAVNGWIPRWVP